MDKKNIYWLIGGIVLTVLIWNFIIDRRQETKIINKTDTLTVTKYVDKIVKVPEYLNPTIQYLPYYDTTYIKIKDSTKVAKADSISDKEKTFTMYDLQYWYPPVNKFTFGNVKVKEKIVEKTITKEVLKPESFFDRFGYSLQAGFGKGLINKEWDVYVGVGVHFRIK